MTGRASCAHWHCQAEKQASEEARSAESCCGQLRDGLSRQAQLSLQQQLSEAQAMQAKLESQLQACESSQKRSESKRLVGSWRDRRKCFGISRKQRPSPHNILASPFYV